MKYNLAVASKNKDKLKQSLSKLALEEKDILVSPAIFFSHFWYESNLSFDELEKELGSLKDVSSFISNKTRNSASKADFPQLIRTLEQKLIQCKLSALLNASFMEPGSLFVFDDYVEMSESSSGIVTGREYFFNSKNPLILEMKRLHAIPQVFSEAYMVILDMAFRDIPPENSLPLYQQIAANIEALGTWYSILSAQPSFMDSRGALSRYLSDWSLKSDEKERVLYVSKP